LRKHSREERCGLHAMAHSHGLRIHKPPARHTCPPPASSSQEVSRQRQCQAAAAKGIIIAGRSRSQQEHSPGADPLSSFLGDKHCSEVKMSVGSRKHTSKLGRGIRVTLNVPKISSTVSETALSSVPSTPEPLHCTARSPSIAFTDPLYQRPTGLLDELTSVPPTTKRLVPMLNLARHSSSSPCATQRSTVTNISRVAWDHQTELQSIRSSEAGSVQSESLEQKSHQVNMPDTRASDTRSVQIAAMGQDHHPVHAQDMPPRQVRIDCSELLGQEDKPTREHLAVSVPPSSSSKIAWSDLVDQREIVEPHFESLMQKALEEKLPSSKQGLQQCDAERHTCVAGSSSSSVPQPQGRLHRRRAMRFRTESAADMRARLRRRVASRWNRLRLAQSLR